MWIPSQTTNTTLLTIRMELFLKCRSKANLIGRVTFVFSHSIRQLIFLSCFVFRLNLSFLQNSLKTGNQSNKPPIAITSSQLQPAVQSQPHPSSSSPERALTKKTNRSTPHRPPHHSTRIPSPIVKEKMKQNYLALVNRSQHQQQLQRKEKEKEKQSRRRPSSSSPPPSSRKEKHPVPSSSSPHLPTARTNHVKKKNEQQEQHTTDPSRSLVQSFLAENNLFGPSTTAPNNNNPTGSQLNSLNNSYSSLKEILSVQKESYPIQHILQNNSFSHPTTIDQQQQQSSRAAVENSLLNTSRVSTSSGKPPLHPSRAQNESSFRKEHEKDEQEDDNEDPNITSLSALLEKYKINIPTEGSTATPTRKLYQHAKKTISSGKKSKKKKRSTSAPPTVTLYRPVPSPTSTWGTSKRIL
jgi:hypothetical protein